MTYTDVLPLGQLNGTKRRVDGSVGINSNDVITYQIKSPYTATVYIDWIVYSGSWALVDRQGRYLGPAVNNKLYSGFEEVRTGSVSETVSNSYTGGSYTHWYWAEYHPYVPDARVDVFKKKSVLVSSYLRVEDLDTPTSSLKLSVSNSNPKSGNILLDGKIFNNGNITYDQFTRLRFEASDTKQSTSVRITASDGKHSDFGTFTINVLNNKPELTQALSSRAKTGEILSLSTLVAATDKDDVDLPKLHYKFITKFNLQAAADKAGGGFFTFDGINPVGKSEFSAAEIATLKFHLSDVAGADTVTVTVGDGDDWSAARTLTLTAANRAPVVTLKSAQLTLHVGEAQSIKELFEAQDKDGPKDLLYEIVDTTTDTGTAYIRYGSLAAPAGQPVHGGKLTWDELDRVKLFAGSNDKKVDQITIRAWDGIDFSEPVTLKVSSDSLRTFTVASLYAELATFADAAYPLDKEPESRTDFDALMTRWTPLPASALFKSPDSVADVYKEDGRFEYLNAAATVAVGRMNGAVTLVVAYRGTDTALGAWSWAQDAWDWPHPIATTDPLSRDYYDKFTVLQSALETYIKENGVQRVLLTGHSLGGVPVQQALFELTSKVLLTTEVEAITVGAPGMASLATVSGGPLVMFQNTGDIVPRAGAQGGNITSGKVVNLTYAEDTDHFSVALHNKYLYRDMVGRLERFLDDHTTETDFLGVSPVDAAKSTAAAWVVFGGTQESWKADSAGTFTHLVVGHNEDLARNELIIGSRLNEYIVGTGGSDHLYGMGGSDTFLLWSGSPIAYGNASGDEYDVRLGTVATITDGAGPGVDTIYLKARPDFAGGLLASTVSIKELRGDAPNLALAKGKNALIDETKLFYSKSGDDLILSYSENGVTTTTIRVKGEASADTRVEFLVLDEVRNGITQVDTISLTSLWDRATATPQPLKSSSGATASSSSAVNGLVAKLSATSPAGAMLDAKPIASPFEGLQRVSIDAAGGDPEASSSLAGISSNSRYVVFNSSARDILTTSYSASAPRVTEVYARDLLTNTTKLLSTGSTGAPLKNGVTGSGLSDDGRFLVFTGLPDEAGYISYGYVPPGSGILVKPTPNPPINLYIKDLATGEVAVVSYDADGKPLGYNGQAFFGSLSPNGRYVAYTLSSEDAREILIRDVSTGDLIHPTVTIDGSESTAPVYAGMFSDDSRYFTFVSADGRFVAGDANGQADLFVRDLRTGTTVRANVGATGVEADRGVVGPHTLSADGTLVLFISAATNLVVGDTNDRADAFLKNLITGEVTRVSEGYSNVSDASMSADGRYVSFTANAGDGSAVSVVLDVDSGRSANLGYSYNAYGLTVVGQTLSDDGKLLVLTTMKANPAYTGKGGTEPASIQNVYSLANPIYDPNANWRPKVVAIDQQVTAGYTVSAEALFAASDRNGDATVAAYEFSDLSPEAASGYFTFNGVKQSSTFQVSAANLHGVRYVAGQDGTVDHIQIRASDGMAWSLPRAFSLSAVSLDVADLRRESLSPDLYGGDRDSGRAAYAADGRWLAFESGAGNLVPGDVNGQSDIFLRDVRAGTSARISVGAGGQESDDASANADISANGGLVVFESWASNLVANDGNAARDVFAWKAATGIVSRISVAQNGGDANGESFDPKLSADGSKVAFTSSATNLGPADANSFVDVYLSDLASGTTSLVSRGSAGNGGNGGSFGARPSANGSVIAFASYADDFGVGDRPGVLDVFAKTMATGSLALASRAADGTPGNADSVLRDLTPDGRYALIESWASNLVAGDTNGTSDLFRKDLSTGEVVRVSQTGAGIQGNGRSFNGWISDDGRFVVFQSEASNLAPIDTNRASDVFVKDLGAPDKPLTRVSHDILGGQIDDGGVPAGLSGDGRFIAFRSGSAHVTFDDADRVVDIFDLPNPLIFNPPEVRAAAERLIERGVATAASDLFQVYDRDGDATVAVEIFDRTAQSDSGSFFLNGSAIPAGAPRVVSGADLAHLEFRTSATVAQPVTDSLSVRAYDGQNWGAWTSFAVATHVNVPPVAAVTDRVVLRSEQVALSPLVTFSDANGEAIIRIQVEDTTTAAGSGMLKSNGLVVTGVADLSPQAFAALGFVGGSSTSAGATDIVRVRAFDGTAWGDWASLRISTDPTNAAPVVRATDRVLTRGASVALDDLVQVFDLNRDAVERVQVRDSNGDALSGAWYLDGVRLAEGADPTSGTPATSSIAGGDLTKLTFRAASTASDVVDAVSVRSFDGFAWSDWANFKIVSGTAAAAPSVSLADAALMRGERIAIASLVSVTDANRGIGEKVEVSLPAGSHGALSYDPSKASAGEVGLVFSWPDLADVTYRADPTLAGTAADRLSVRFFDGSQWSAWDDAALTSSAGNAAPTVFPRLNNLERGASTPVEVLFDVADLNGDAVVRYEFRASAISAAQLSIDGVVAPSVAVDADHLGTVLLTGGTAGSSTDSFEMRASDGSAWSAWTSISLSVALSNAAPMVIPTGPTLGLGQIVSLAAAVTVFDPNGDPVRAAQVFDPSQDATSSFLRIAGAQVTAGGAATAVQIDGLGQVELVGGSTSGSDVVSVRVFDGLVWSDWTDVLVTTLTSLSGGDLPQQPGTGDASGFRNYGSASENLVVNLMSGTADGPVGGVFGHKDIPGVVDLVTGAGADAIYGSNADNTIDAGAGNDTIFAGAGNDVLHGGGGNDVLVGHAGGDGAFLIEFNLLDGGPGDDVLYAGAGDSVDGGAGHDALQVINAHDFTLDLGASSIEYVVSDFGNDSFDAHTQTESVQVYAGGGNDRVTGSDHGDVIWVGSGNDTVLGGEGNDVIVGDVGADSLSGGGGDDTLYVDAADTFLDGGAGYNAAYITGLLGDPGMVLDVAASHFAFVADFAGNADSLNGSAATVALTIYAGAGNDTVAGGSGADVIWGQAGNDHLVGNGGNDVLVGGVGADTLEGGAGSDALYGNSGNGSDGARDVFVLGPSSGVDFVFDFTHGEDKIDLTAFHTTVASITVADAPDGSGHAQVFYNSVLLAAVANGAGHLTASDFLF